MERGGPSHDSFPRPDDPMIKPGGALDEMAKKARADFAAITPEEIDAAMGDAKPGAEGKDGRLKKVLDDDTVKDIMNAHYTSERWRQEAAEFPTLTPAERAGLLKTADGRYALRQLRLAELGKTDPATVAAILETDDGVRKLRNDFIKKFKMEAPSQDRATETSPDLARLLESDAEAASMARRLRVAQEQLERLHKTAGIE